MRYISVLTTAFLFVGCVSGLARAEGPPVAQVGPPVAFVAEPPTAKVDCNCALTGNCTCDQNCTCPGCKKHATGLSLIAEWALASSIGSTDVAPATITRTIMQRQCFTDQFGIPRCQMVPVTVVEAAPATVAVDVATYKVGDICPCCGMVMTASQAATAAKVKAASMPPASYGAGATFGSPITYSTGFTTFGAGDCASCASAGPFSAGDGSSIMAGSGRPGLFPRWKARRAARAAGGGGCGG